MSGVRHRQAVDAAADRVRRDMQQATAVQGMTLRFRRMAIPIAALLFAAGFALRVAVDDPGALLANAYAIPIALLAVTFGVRGGAIAAAVGFVLVYLWGDVTDTHVGVLGYSTRGAVFVLVALIVGWYAERLPEAAALQRQSEYELELRNEELERTNAYLGQTVRRLEAFSEIARAVGGETELRRVLEIILEHGREVAAARTLLVCLPEGDDLVVVASTTPSGEGRRVPIAGSPPGQVLTTGRSMLVSGEATGIGGDAVALSPLAFRGNTFGVLAAVDSERFDDEDAELLDSIAASAATAVVTAQSVARDRLRDSIAAGEEARRRWARELHDDTLQGLGGLRVLLSSALRSGSPDVLRASVEEAVDQTKDEIDSLRNLIAELRPAALDELGLEPALEHLAQRSADSGIDVAARFDLPAERRLAPELESTIYRVVQEALTNVAKHSGAEHVRVEVGRSNGSVVVTVEDDGCGFDPDGACDGLGLVGMRERVELAGGELEIASRPAGPTTVRAVVPAG